MANHKSAAKRARQSLRRQAVGIKTKNELKTWEKKVRTAIAKKDKANAQTHLLAFESRLMKAVQKGRVPFATGSRKISRLASQVSSL